MVLNKPNAARGFRWSDPHAHRLWVYIWIIALSGALVIAYLERKNQSIKSEVTKLRGETAGLAKLEADLGTLRSQSISPIELEHLRREHDEITSLAERVAILGNQAVTDEILDRARFVGRSKTSPPQVGPKLFSRNPGRSSPMDTLASVVWAATRGDVSSLAPAITFDREGRKNAEAIFSQLPSSVQRQYGSLENVYATLVAASIPLGLSDAQIVREQTEPNGDRGLTLKLVRGNGSTRESSFRFRLFGSSWQLVVPDKIVANFSRALVSPQGSGNHKEL